MPKIIQISALENALYALDDMGNIHVLNRSGKDWHKFKLPDELVEGKIDNQQI